MLLVRNMIKQMFIIHCLLVSTTSFITLDLADLSVFKICWFPISNLIKSYKIKTKIFHVVFSNDQAHRHLTLYIFLMIKIYTLNLYASLDIGFIFLL